MLCESLGTGVHGIDWTKSVGAPVDVPRGALDLGTTFDVASLVSLCLLDNHQHLCKR